MEIAECVITNNAFYTGASLSAPSDSGPSHYERSDRRQSDPMLLAAFCKPPSKFDSKAVHAGFFALSGSHLSCDRTGRRIAGSISQESKNKSGKPFITRRLAGR